MGSNQVHILSQPSTETTNKSGFYLSLQRLLARLSSSTKGFGLLEILVAVLLLGIGLTAVLSSFVSAKLLLSRSRGRLEATYIIEEISDRIRDSYIGFNKHQLEEAAKSSGHKMAEFSQDDYVSKNYGIYRWESKLFYEPEDDVLRDLYFVQVDVYFLVDGTTKEFHMNSLIILGDFI